MTCLVLLTEREEGQWQKAVYISVERETGFENGWPECDTVTYFPASGVYFAGTVSHRRHWFPWALHEGGQNILYCLVLLLNIHAHRSFH